MKPTDLTMEELAELDAQGYRVIGSLRPGDSFLWKKATHTIRKTQQMGDRMLIVVTETPAGEPRDIGKLDGSVEQYQPRITFQMDAYALVSAVLTDEHFREEAEKGQVHGLATDGWVP